MDYQQHVFIGVDTHKQDHTAAVFNCFHQELELLTVANDPQEFSSFLAKIKDLIPGDETPVFGLEDTSGLGRALAQWLLAQGYVVKEVNASLTSDQRKRQPNPDKSDPDDARAVARVLISRWDELPQVSEDGNFVAIRQLFQHRRRLVKQKTQVKNQLHNLLHQHYPHYKKFFSDIFGKTALAFWEEFPHPETLADITQTELLAFLKEQAPNIQNHKAEQILKLVSTTCGDDISISTRKTLIPMLVQELRLLNSQIDALESEIESAVEKSVYRLTSMTGMGAVLAAQFISTIKDIDRFSSADELARYAGLAPAEHSSGSSRRKRRSKYGCRLLNNAFYLLAVQQITVRGEEPANPVAYQYYQKKLAEGKSKVSALVCLQRRLVDIIYAMMRDKSEYHMPDTPEYSVLKAG